MTFRIWSLLLFLAGVVLIAQDIQLMLIRFSDPSVSRLIALAGTVLLLTVGILEITGGIKGFVFSNNVSRGRRYRAISSKIRTFKLLALFSLFFSVIHLILSCVIGIMVFQLIVLIVCGIMIPLFYMASAKRLRV